jgi:hypothetical protein
VLFDIRDSPDPPRRYAFDRPYHLRIQTRGGSRVITVLAVAVSLAEGGIDEPSAFGLAFVVGALLSGVSIVSTLFMSAERIMRRHRLDVRG